MPSVIDITGGVAFAHLWVAYDRCPSMRRLMKDVVRAWRRSMRHSMEYDDAFVIISTFEVRVRPQWNANLEPASVLERWRSTLRHDCLGDDHA
jgi:hypothetical protein